MSTSVSNEERLRAEVRSLRNALRELTLRVDRHEDQLSEIPSIHSGSARDVSVEVESASGTNLNESFSSVGQSSSYQVVSSVPAVGKLRTPLGKSVNQWLGR